MNDIEILRQNDKALAVMALELAILEIKRMTLSGDGPNLDTVRQIIEVKEKLK